MIGALLSRLTGRAEPEADEWADDTEFEPPTFLRDGEWQRGAVGPVHVVPLVWSMTPPKSAGWFWCRFPGNTEFEPVHIEGGFDYGPGLEWAGPLPEPRP